MVAPQSGSGAAAPVSYLWEPPGKASSVRLRGSIIPTLQFEIKAFASFRPPGAGVGNPPDATRGAEVGGILLGRVVDGPTPIISIEDYEPIPCEYRDGPYYVLSDGDRRNFEEALARYRASGSGRSVVGYYRSDIRNRIRMSNEDLAFIHAYFSDPLQVFLIIQASGDQAAKAAFFAWEAGHMRREPSEEFEFEPGATGLPEVSALPEPEIHAADGAERPIRKLALEEPGAVQLQEAAPARPSAPKSRRALWAAVAVLAIAAAALAWFEYRAGGIPGKPQEAPAAAGQFNLKIEREGGDLRLRWDRKAAAVLSAQSATVSIEDGEFRHDLRLGPTDLQAGTVLYTPATNQISFRLSVRSSDNRTFSESIWVISPSLPAQQMAEAGQPPASVSRPATSLPPAPNAAIATQPRAARTVPQPAGGEAAAVRPQTALAAAPPRTSPPAVQTPATQPAVAQGPAVQERAASPSADVVAAPARVETRAADTGPAAGTTASRAPAASEPARPAPEPTRRDSGAPPAALPAARNPEAAVSPQAPARGAPGSVEQTQVAYIPPVAIRQVAPVISTSEREMIRRMSRPLEIQVSVSIDEFGKVTRAEPVSEGSGMADYMGRLAARAARQWQFRPAKRNGRDVPSEMMVRFQFGSPR